MNICEMTSGMAMMCGLPDGVRGIVTSMSIKFHKKARGTITAESKVIVPTVTADTDFEVVAECRDPAGTVVASARINWRLGPIPAEGAAAPRA
jgi:acyl-coenzyme A thioesterase PaaI-like protein